MSVSVSGIGGHLVQYVLQRGGASVGIRFHCVPVSRRVQSGRGILVV